MIPKLPALHFAAMALLGLTAPVLAQDKAGLNIDEAATGKPGGVAQYDMAQALFALGVANKDALLALMAARLFSGWPLVMSCRARCAIGAQRNDSGNMVR